MFWATAFLSILLIRLLADYVKVRLYWNFKNHKLTIMQYQKAVKSNGIHVHHFVWGILATFVAVAALYWNQVYVGVFAAGIGVALVASEAKELVLQKWGR